MRALREMSPLRVMSPPKGDESAECEEFAQSAENAETTRSAESVETNNSSEFAESADTDESAEIQESTTATAQSKVIVLDDTDGDVVSESSIAEPSGAHGGGYIKRWFSKAVSWIKRLIGY